MGIRDYVKQRPPIAAPLQAATVLPDPYNVVQQSELIPVMDAWGMPDDLPLPVAESNGVFVPATAETPDIIDYDPWLWAMPAKILDHSRPVAGQYGEPSTPGKAHTIVAEWGGMPSPVRSFQDPTASVLYSPRQVNYHQSVGPAGRWEGPQQTAYEASAQTPQPDYWSTIILQGR